MTVQELINALQEMPSDAIVMISSVFNDIAYEHVDSVSMDEVGDVIIDTK